MTRTTGWYRRRAVLRRAIVVVCTASWVRRGAFRRERRFFCFDFRVESVMNPKTWFTHLSRSLRSRAIFLPFFHVAPLSSARAAV